MMAEAVDLLNLGPAKIAVDATLGGGSYAREMANRVGSDGTLIALDRDPAAIEASRQLLESALPNIIVRQENFGNLDTVLNEIGISRVDAVMMDLGVSAHQLEDPGYGISFASEGRLDMRMGPDALLSADDLINRWPEAELVGLFKRYGEERWCRRIARRIVESRGRRPIQSAKELSEIVVAAIPPKFRSRRIHPATRIMLAVRAAVNDEEGALTDGLRAAIQRLRASGRLVVIAYHSVEDRIVKTEMNRHSGRCVCEPPVIECHCGKRRAIQILTKKPLAPSQEEIINNPRARSARLRAAERLPD